MVDDELKEFEETQKSRKREITRVEEIGKELKNYYDVRDNTLVDWRVECDNIVKLGGELELIGKSLLQEEKILVLMRRSFLKKDKKDKNVSDTTSIPEG